jgi:hypothetical protein
VWNLSEKPRGSRAVSAVPDSPATVEKRERLGGVAGLGKQSGPGVAGQVLGHGQQAVSPGALGVRHPLAVEVRHLLHQLIVLHQHRAARSGGLGVLVVRDGRCGRGGHAGLCAEERIAMPRARA